MGSIAARTSPIASIASGASPAAVATSVASSPRSTVAAVEVAELEPRRREQLADEIIEHEHLAIELLERLRVASAWSRAVSISTRMWPSGVRSSCDTAASSCALILELLARCARAMSLSAFASSRISPPCRAASIRVSSLPSPMSRAARTAMISGRVIRHAIAPDIADSTMIAIAMCHQRGCVPQADAGGDATDEREREPDEDPAAHPRHQPPRHPVRAGCCCRHISRSACHSRWRSCRRRWRSWWTPVTRVARDVDAGLARARA